MSAKDVVRQFCDAINRGDLNTAIDLCADDMQFSGPSPTALGKREFAAMMNALLHGIPDWNLHESDLREAGDKCTGRFDITGTHKADLSLPIPGMQTIRASGKTIKQPTEYPEFTVKNGKISKMHVDVGPNGGIPGLVKQLGASMPMQPNPQATGRPSAPSHP